MKKRIFLLPIIILSIIGMGIIGCDSDDDSNNNENDTPTGTLEFYANGEDFIRDGFTSKDGWDITFEHVFVCLDNITAYQTKPAYDPQIVGELDRDTVKVEVDIGGPYTIDLADDEYTDPILVDQVTDAEIGTYNAISWSMVDAASGDAEGYSVVLIGKAEKAEEDTITFTISIEIEYSYSGGDYVGDADKGGLIEDGTADLEMTFHFDHLFGDFGEPADDHVNLGAVGFQPFADIAVDGVVDVDMAGLKSNDDFSTENYLLMLETLPTLGHVGEGHCHCEQWW